VVSNGCIKVGHSRFAGIGGYLRRQRFEAGLQCREGFTGAPCYANSSRFTRNRRRAVLLAIGGMPYDLSSNLTVGFSSRRNSNQNQHDVVVANHAS
jgi:hypothetical protein